MSSYPDIPLFAPMRKPAWPLLGLPPLASSGRGLAPTWPPYPPLASSGGGLAPCLVPMTPTDPLEAWLVLGPPGHLWPPVEEANHAWSQRPPVEEAWPLRAPHGLL